MIWRKVQKISMHEMMFQCIREQGHCNPSFGSSLGYHMATLHTWEYWKAFVCVEVRPCTLSFRNALRSQFGADSIFAFKTVTCLLCGNFDHTQSWTLKKQGGKIVLSFIVVLNFEKLVWNSVPYSHQTRLAADMTHSSNRRKEKHWSAKWSQDVCVCER